MSEKIPPIKRSILLRRKPTTTDEQQQPPEVIASKVWLAMRGLEKFLPSLTIRQSVEPTVNHFGKLDWSVPYDSLPDKAKELLELIILQSHPSILQQVLTLARQRILSDYELWVMHRDIERLLKIGDLTYCRKRGVKRVEDMM